MHENPLATVDHIWRRQEASLFVLCFSDLKMNAYNFQIFDSTFLVNHNLKVIPCTLSTLDSEAWSSNGV